MTRASLIATLVVVAFFAGITGIRLAYTLAYTLLLLLVVAYIWSRLLARRLLVTRESPVGTFSVGDTFTERFTVRNASALPLPYCEVHDRSRFAEYQPGRACALRGGDGIAWTARGSFTRRGHHRFLPLDVVLGDPFGLFPRRLQAGEEQSVLVYPAARDLGELSGGWFGGATGDANRGRPADVAPDVATVREYDPADGLSRIHWASTARTGRLMSRTYDTRHSTDVLVVLDLQRDTHWGLAPESTLEYAVTLAASVCHTAITRGQAAGLVCNDAVHTAIGAGRGDAQRMRILGHLASCVADGELDLAQLLDRHAGGWRGRGGLVVITAKPVAAWVDALIDAGVRGQRHLAVVVDPVSFGAPGSPFAPTASWRLAADWWVIRQGDALSVPAGTNAAAR